MGDQELSDELSGSRSGKLVDDVVGHERGAGQLGEERRDVFLVDPRQAAVGSLHRLQRSCKGFQLLVDEAGLWIREQTVNGRP